MSRRLHRLAPVGVSLALIAAPLALLPSAAEAATSLSGSPYDGTDGVRDLHSSIVAQDDDGTPDTLQGGVKEDTDCPQLDGGGAPDKADLVTGYVGSAKGTVGSDPHTFLYLGWLRSDTDGTATINFELNSGTVPCGSGSPFKKRTLDEDLLFSYNFQGGQITGIEVRIWELGNGNKAEWSEPELLDAGNGEYEAKINPNMLFGELVIDMTAAGFFDSGCKNFSTATMRSRASSSSFENQLKDIILPFPVEVTNCGSLIVEKTVVGGAGESFNFTVDCGEVDVDPESFSLVHDGSQEIPNIPLGSACSVSENNVATTKWSTKYSVDESESQNGRTASGIVIELGSQTVAFTNTRLTGDLTISKTAVGADGTFKFEVDCTDNSFDRLGEDAVTITTSGGSGSAPVIGIPTGTTCTVTEVVNPLFTSTPASHTVSITAYGATAAFTNTAKAIGIQLDKKVNAGDHAAIGAALLAHASDPLTYTVVISNSGQVPLTITGLTDTLFPDFAESCDQDVGSTLAVGGSFTCTYHTAATGDAHNVAEVTAVDGLGRQASDSDGTYVDVITPDIIVAKTGPDQAHVGDRLDYTIMLTNAGNTPLSPVTINDLLCSNLTRTDDRGPAPLDPGESWTFTCFHIVVEGDGDQFVNTVEVSGQDALEREVTDDASWPTDILKPAIIVTKSGPDRAHVGDTLAYTIVVSNEGNTPLTAVEVSDLGCVGVVSSDADEELGVEESWTFTCTHVVVDSDGDRYVNTVEVSGQDALEREVTDDASWPTDILRPAIGVTKSGPDRAHVGDTITYTLTVANPGNTPLDITDWDDDVCDGEPVLTDKEGTDNRLDPGEVWVYNCSHVVVDGDPDRLVNTATVTGTDDLEKDVTSTDDAVTTILRPAISITKTGPTNAHVGDPVVYTLVVINTGNTPLSSVAVTDPKCDGLPVRSDSDADGPLSPGESWTYNCTHVVLPGDGASILNTAIAEGTDPLGETVDSSDDHVAVVLHPAISIVKTANPESVSVSGPVTYTYVVTNTGDTMLFNVLVTDDILGAIGSVGELAAGESVTMAKTVDVDASTPPRNIGTAVGTDILGQTVSATDDAVITVVLGVVAELPRTGAPLHAQTQAALAMIEVGIFMTLAGRRRRNIRRAD